jgi:CheY-like chemotaxis protein
MLHFIVEKFTEKHWRLATTRNEDSRMSRQKNKKVLVVDDLEVNFLVIKHLMEARGFNLEFAHDRDSAVKMCELYQFDAILMDISIPDVDGFTIHQELGERGLITANTHMIAYTVHCTETERQSLLDAGFETILSKPIDSDSAEHLKILLNQRAAKRLS